MNPLTIIALSIGVAVDVVILVLMCRTFFQLMKGK